MKKHKISLNFKKPEKVTDPESFGIACSKNVTFNRFGPISGNFKATLQKNK